MLRYKEILLKVPRNEFERLSDEVFVLGTLGTEIVSESEEVLFRVYFRQEVEIPDDISKYVIEENFLEDRDWNEEWKKYYKPVQITKGIWIVPSWEKGKFKEPENSVVIYIHPGRGFGTGTHETTQLVIEYMEETLKPGISFLDVGTGSGILSILAKKLGAGRVVACDIQEGIEEEVERNSSLSGISGVEFVQGSIDSVSGKFDVVVANIEKHLLSPLLEEIYKRTKNTAIFSGILKSQAGEFLKEVEGVGFKLESQRSKGEWTAFLCRR
ncbi:ribosomal protein L11 methyltransferase [Balnearium lithotrophicum]|uniref:Ribosomal protein L11 methyltransferase n=1 Tax=Balnearium lithotrophicum TaxID=223788 RepID=A0A521AP34_9BACT|nr:50S ribosomal protein L11 methyltransferase [Balnearium lithotrophicum]SMO36390.1 ribosomal protein L11 methyltransferase [Balnearium lithotrophicum]